MPSPLSVTVVEIQESSVIVATPDGQRWSLPTSMILGKAVLDQPLFVVATAPQADQGSQHPLAQTILEHLLEPLP